MSVLQLGLECHHDDLTDQKQVNVNASDDSQQMIRHISTLCCHGKTEIIGEKTDPYYTAGT
jgi:hypothetical protein